MAKTKFQTVKCSHCKSPLVPAVTNKEPCLGEDEAEGPRRQWYGTIDEEYVRKRDSIATRKRGFTLSIDLITRLEVFCANPKRSTNLAAEEALSQWLDRQEQRRAPRGT